MACSYYRVKHHENRRTLSRSATFRPGKFRARVDRVRSQELPVFACCRCRTPRQCHRENSRHKRYSHPVKSQLGVPTGRWLAAPTGLPPRTGSLSNASTQCGKLATVLRRIIRVQNGRPCLPYAQVSTVNGMRSHSRVYYKLLVPVCGSFGFAGERASKINRSWYVGQFG